MSGLLARIRNARRVVLPGDRGTSRIRPAIGITYVLPDGSDLPVEVVPFEFPQGPHGIGVYFTDDDGEQIRGTVLRWDHGPDEKPTVVHWRKPGPDGPRRCV